MASLADTIIQDPGEMEGVIEPVISGSTNLQDWLRDGLNDDSVADEIYNKLKKEGIENIETLTLADDDDLNGLCKAVLNLDISTKIKFKSLIKRQRRSDQLKQTQNVTVITIEEQREINKFDQKISRCKHIQNALHSAIDQIEQQSLSVTSQINEKFQTVITALQQRQKSMNEKVQTWKAQKTENIQKQLSNLQKCDDGLKKVRIGITKIIQINQSADGHHVRKAEIKKTANGLDEQYDIFEDDESALKYIGQHTKLMKVSFTDKLAAIIAKFGLFDENVKNAMSVRPSISLQPAIENRKEKSIKASKVRLEWNVNGHDNEDEKVDMPFFVKCAESNNKWMVLAEDKVGKASKNEYFVNIAKPFAFEKLYKFQIDASIVTAFGMELRIKSNVVEFKREKPKSKEIELEYHSHRAHYDSTYHPRNLLSDNERCYASKSYGDFSGREIDWLVFKFKKKDVILTHVAIGQFHVSDAQNLKEMKVFVGNGDGKWNVVKSNGNKIIKCKDGKELQWFDLDLMDTPHKYVRIELIDNEFRRLDYAHFVLKRLKFKGFSL